MGGDTMMQVAREEEAPQIIVKKRKRAVAFDLTTEETTKEKELQDADQEMYTEPSVSAYKPPTQLSFNLKGSYRVLPLKSIVKDATKTLLVNNLDKVMGIKTVEDLFLVSISEIQRELKIPMKQVQALIEEVSSYIAPPKRSTLQLETDELLKHRKLSTGCRIMDQTLGGGIITKNITEIVGEAASGKTQFCLHLSLRCPLPEEHGGLAGKVLYISTNGEFPGRRFRTMATEFAEQMKSCGVEVVDPFEQIYTASAPDLEKLWELVNEQLPILLNRQRDNVKLVVIDSLAALIRSEYDNNQSVERSRSLWMISSQMRKLSDTHNFAVVIVNQVTDKFDNTSDFIFSGTNKKLVPSLGLSWSKSINTRIMLRKTNRTCEIDSEILNHNTDEEPTSKKRKLDSAVVREMSVIFSAITANSTCMFIVQNSGLCGLE